MVLILGAGLAGLSAAHHLGGDYRLVERAGLPGGLCRTEVRDGFRFDATGHWLHLRDGGVRALAEELLPGGWVRVERRAGVYSHGVFTPYPYQVNTHGLPPQVVAENLLGFVEANYGEKGRALRARDPRDFAEFVLRHLGEGFARNFLFPYNRKLWTVPPEELTAEWMGRFVPQPTLEQVVRGAVGLAQEGLGYNATFLYPREGGIEAFPAALARRLSRPAECGLEPVSLDAARRRARLSSGEELSWGALVSTIPLPALAGLLADAPPEVRAAAARLRAATVTYVNVAARGGGAAPFHWVYLPEPSFAAYRASSPSAAVPSLAPPGARTLQVEFSGREPLEPDRARKTALETLLRLGFLAAPGDVLFTEARVIPDAYVIHDADWSPARRFLRDWLAARGIFTAGRSGSWEYASMEDAVLAGRAAAERASR